MCISCFIIFLINQYRGYEYGLGDVFGYKKLPYGLQPKYNRYDYFDIIDDEGFELAGKGFRYINNSFKINEILGYGYNDTAVILICSDNLNSIKYLSSYETGTYSVYGNPQISFEDMSESAYQKSKRLYKWTYIDVEEIDSIKLKKVYSLMGTILFFFSYSIALVKKRKYSR